MWRGKACNCVNFPRLSPENRRCQSCAPGPYSTWWFYATAWVCIIATSLPVYTWYWDSVFTQWIGCHWQKSGRLIICSQGTTALLNIRNSNVQCIGSRISHRHSSTQWTCLITWEKTIHQDSPNPTFSICDVPSYSKLHFWIWKKVPLCPRDTACWTTPQKALNTGTQA